MRMIDDGKGDGRRALLARWLKGMAPFVQAPAVVLALMNEIDLLPEVLTILPDPERAGFAIERDTPRIAKTVRPDFRSRAGR